MRSPASLLALLCATGMLAGAAETTAPKSRVLVQQSKSAATADPKQRLCEDLYSTMTLGRTVPPEIQKVIQPIEAVLRERKVPAPAISEIRLVTVRFVDETVKSAEFKKLLGDVYGAMFTTEELRQLLAFFRTGVGSKLLRTLHAERAGSKSAAPTLSPQEQSTLQNFLNSAAGQKFLQVGNQADERLTNAAEALFKSKQDVLEGRLRAVLQKHGLTL